MIVGSVSRGSSISICAHSTAKTWVLCRMCNEHVTAHCISMCFSCILGNKHMQKELTLFTSVAAANSHFLFVRCVLTCIFSCGVNGWDPSLYPLHPLPLSYWHSHQNITMCKWYKKRWWACSWIYLFNILSVGCRCPIFIYKHAHMYTDVQAEHRCWGSAHLLFFDQ